MHLDKKRLMVCVAAVLVALVPALGAAAVIVSPDNLGDWQITASDGNTAPPPPSAVFVVSPPVPPLGIGVVDGAGPI